MQPSEIATSVFALALAASDSRTPIPCRSDTYGGFTCDLFDWDDRPVPVPLGVADHVPALHRHGDRAREGVRPAQRAAQQTPEVAPPGREHAQAPGRLQERADAARAVGHRMRDADLFDHLLAAIVVRVRR